MKEIPVSVAPPRLSWAASCEHSLISVTHQLMNVWKSPLCQGTLKSLPLPWGCTRSVSCVCCLGWFHSKWHLSMGKRRTLQTNGSLFQHLHRRGPRNGFHQQNSLWVPLTARAPTRGMLRWKSKECHSFLEPIPSVSNRQPKKTH